MLTIAQRVSLARRVTESMQASYEAVGEEGDFDDAERYLRDDATDQELLAEEEKWCKQM